MRAFLIASALALGGCASQSSALKYTRTDGKPADPAQQQSALAQCKGEAVSGTVDPLQAVAQARKEAAVIDACMARNGYIQVKQ
jgi:hypothetical protein